MEVKRVDIFDFKLVLGEHELQSLIKKSDEWDMSVEDTIMRMIAMMLVKQSKD